MFPCPRVMRGLALGLLLIGRSHAFVSPSAIPRSAVAWRQAAATQDVSSSPSCQRCSSSSAAEGADSFSFADLQRELNRRRVESEMSSQRSPAPAVQDGEAFMEEQMVLRKTMLKAYVIVYNQGQAEEGVYTLFVEGRNVLRAWEDKPEAARYALMLRAEDLPLGKPTELPMSQIIGFCKENGVGLELIPRGRGLQPPSRNKTDFDFDCSKGEESRPGASGAPGAAGQLDESLFTPQELARIKIQFEKYLEEGEEEA